MFILKMLEEGKITSEEAARLWRLLTLIRERLTVAVVLRPSKEKQFCR